MFYLVLEADKTLLLDTFLLVQWMKIKKSESYFQEKKKKNLEMFWCWKSRKFTRKLECTEVNKTKVHLYHVKML